MTPKVNEEMELEIAHVLFIDTVGYSKLLMDQQREVLKKLNDIVRNTRRFRTAESAGKLIRLPTGDGMALVFSDSPDAPAECALEIARASKGASDLPLRMGIHSGPVSRVIDVNDRCNAAGAGINVAERVMSCGDAGHILLSKRAAEDLVDYAQWRPFLHEIGECTVKHGTKITLVNLYDEEVGNPALPLRCREASGGGSTGVLGFRRKAVILAAAIAALALISYTIFSFSSGKSPTLANDGVTPHISPKSIAVLPFDNLSDEKENAYLADGVQDEIMTDLAKIGTLKVISRTSVMAFRNSAARNLRDIARDLGVAYIVEGTVQRVGQQVRIRAQLIDARIDAHVWAESYNRDVADIFALESELAQKIVSQLKTKISPQEKTSIEERPTADLIAYSLYVRAKGLISGTIFDTRRKENLEEAVVLLTEAVRRDPGFVLAYYQLAHAHDQLYFTGVDHTPQRLKMAGDAVEAVERLRPGSGEAHLALAKHLYWGNIDINRAREELARARRVLPNDPLPVLLSSYIDRRQGRWDESIHEMQRALELDPRNPAILQQLSLSYENLRTLQTLLRLRSIAHSCLHREISQFEHGALFWMLEWRADTKPLHSTIQAIIAENPGAAGSIAEQWMQLALCERDGEAASRALCSHAGQWVRPAEPSCVVRRVGCTSERRCKRRACRICGCTHRTGIDCTRST